MSDDHLLAERLLAERAERRRIAEQLHDGPVQHVAALCQMLDAAVQALEADDPGATAGRLGDQIPLECLDFVEHPSRRAEDAFAHRGEHHVPARADEQR